MESLKHKYEGDGIEIIGRHLVRLSPEEIALPDDELKLLAEQWLLSRQLETVGVDVDILGILRSRNGSYATVGYAALVKTEVDYANILWELACQANFAA